MTTGLAEFLTARLDEDEAVALNAAGGALHPEVLRHWDHPSAVLFVGMQPEEAKHATRHDPARVLADVAAKRAIVAQAVLLTEQADSMPYGHANKHAFEGQALAWRLAARLLAQPYADHPDFDPAWRA